MTLLLYAVLPSGPRALSVPAGRTNLHDVLEDLPFGVYSAMRTFGHERFLWLDRHLERTDRSMAGLGWPEPLDRDRVRRALHETAREYPLPDSRIRFDVLREPAPFQGVESDLFLALMPYAPVPEEFLREGVRVELAPHLVRDEPRIKTTEFVRVRKPLPYGTREAFEHLLLDSRQRILECSSANIAFVRGREIVTAGEGVLEGVTLAVVLHIAVSRGMTVRHERVPLSAVGGFDEAFLSSSTRGVVPVIKVVDQVIGDGSVGAATRELTRLYYEYAERESRPAWPAPVTRGAAAAPSRNPDPSRA